MATNPTLTEEQKYELDQKKKMDSYVIGRTDPHGNKIVQIYVKADEYIIYDTNAGPSSGTMRLKIHTKKIVDEALVKRFGEIKSYFDEFLSAIIKTSATPHMKGRAAGAIAVALNDDQERAKRLFEALIKEVYEEYKTKVIGRLIFLGGAILFTLFLVVSSIISYVNRGSNFILNNTILFEYLYAVTFASLGGLFSISLKSGSLIIEKTFGKCLYFIQGAERIVFSIAGGIFCYTLIKGDIAIGFINGHQGGNYAALSMCFLAGFSETLIPNTLSSLEKKSDKKK